MTCKMTDDQIMDYLDDLLTEEEKKQVDLHLAECETCRQSVETSQMVMQALKELPMKTLPEDFTTSLHDELVKVSDEVKEKYTSKNKKSWLKTMNWKKGTSYVAAALLVAVVGIGGYNNLSGGSDFNMKSAEAVEVEAMMAQDSNVRVFFSEADTNQALGTKAGATEEGMAAPSLAQVDEIVVTSAKLDDDLQARKLIKTGDIQLEVLSYSEAVAAIKHQVNMLGGYIENSYTGSYNQYIRGENVELKEGYMVLRIPQDAFESVFDQVGQLGEVISQNMNTSDISDQYRDMVNEVKNLEVREEALRKIMDKAETVTDIIEVERELSRVRADINAYQGTLQQWDRLVSLSSLHVIIREVEDLTSYVDPPSKNVFQRAKDAFIRTTNNLIDTLENAFVVFIGSLPWLLPLTLVAVTGLVIFRRKRKKEK